MKKHLLASLCSILVAFSCVNNIEEILMDDEHVIASGGGVYGPYPMTSSKVPEQVDVEPDQYYWKCGSEWISVKGPDGKMIQKEIPLQCDPSADFYLGCPEKVNQ